MSPLPPWYVTVECALVTLMSMGITSTLGPGNFTDLSGTEKISLRLGCMYLILAVCHYMGM